MLESSLAVLLSGGVALRKVEPHIYSVLGDSGDADPFQKHALFYDAVICNPIYNRLMWGYSIKSYDALTASALASSTDGWVLDAGCGSLAFTARTYLRSAGRRPVIFLDRSLGLLKIAKARLEKLGGSVPQSMVFLQADAMKLPFKPWIFTTVVSLNLLHVLSDAKEAVRGLKMSLIDEGSMTFTTLVAGGRFSDRCLRYLLMKTSGTVPRSARGLISIFNELNMPVKMEVAGNMAFIRYNV